MPKPCREFAAVSLFACLFLIVVGSPAVAEESEELIREHWRLSRSDGMEIGWQYERTFKVVDGDEVRYRSETGLFNEIVRPGDSLSVSNDTVYIETVAGEVLEITTTIKVDDATFITRVQAQGDEALVTVESEKSPGRSTIPWGKDVLGPVGIRNLMLQKGFEPGTKYSYKYFEVKNTRILARTITVVGDEETELIDGRKALLHHTITISDLIPSIKLYEWWDDDAVLRKSQLEMMGMNLEAFHATELRAKNPGDSGARVDLAAEAMAETDINLPNPGRLKSVLFRFAVRNEESASGDDEAGENAEDKAGFLSELADVRQEIVSGDDKTALVRISSKEPTASQAIPLEDPPDELAEYLRSNSMIQSDLPAVKEKALEVIGSEEDAWKAAGLLTRFVHEHITDKNMGTGFASAGEALEKRSGDCTEHGVLLAALCRSVGIPARVAMGYMYLGGVFAAHMWTEVWIDGEWYAVDGSWGIAPVDPTHVAFFRSSLESDDLSEVFVEATQDIGNLDISVIEFLSLDGVTYKAGRSYTSYAIEGDVYSNSLHGIKIRAPEGYKFTSYERRIDDLSFVLLRMKGGPTITLRATPVDFAFSTEKLIEVLEGGGFENVKSQERKVGDRDGALIAYDNNEKPGRILIVFDKSICYSLQIQINDLQEDLKAFEFAARSIKFLDG